MMDRNMKKLLSKKGWTGKEIGQALLNTLAHDVKNKGKSERPLFSESDLDQMLANITSPSEGQIYNIYVELFRAITEAYNKGLFHLEKFEHGLLRLEHSMDEAGLTELLKREKVLTPYLVTKTQYERLQAEAKADLEAKTENFYSLVFDISGHCRGEHANLPEEIKEIVKAYKEKPAENKRYLFRLYEIFGMGEYELENGIKQGSMSVEEWNLAYEAAVFKKYPLTVPEDREERQELFFQIFRDAYKEKARKGKRLLYEGAEAIRREYLEMTGGILEETDDEITEALENVMGEDDRYSYSLPPLEKKLSVLFEDPTPVRWIYPDKQPKEATKYCMLEVFDDFYLREMKSPSKGISKKRQLMKDYKKEFPELFEAIKQIIEDHVPQARGLAANQYYKPLLTFKELADSGIDYYKDLTVPRNHDIADLFFKGSEEDHDIARRITRSGIAIVQSPPSYFLDENGDYVETERFLGSYDEVKKRNALDNLKKVTRAIRENAVIEGASYLFRFNALMKILAEVYDVPSLAEDIQFSSEKIETTCKALNNKLYSYYFQIKGDTEDGKSCRKEFKELFKPLDLKAFEPSLEALNSTNETIQRIGFSPKAKHEFYDLDAFMEELRGQQ